MTRRVTFAHLVFVSVAISVSVTLEIEDEILPQRRVRTPFAISQVESKAETEPEAIKEQVAKEMAEYLYAFFRTSANQLKPDPLEIKENMPYPGQAFDYSSLKNAKSKFYIKKSGSPSAVTGSQGPFSRQQQIRFHQCYFNPISCFR